MHRNGRSRWIRDTSLRNQSSYTLHAANAEMSEKRKADMTIVASVLGKRTKVELFHRSKFPKRFRHNEGDKYRVRIDGKWTLGNHCFTVSEVLRQLRGWMIRTRKKRKREPHGVSET